jgi:hypothetical protein
LHLPPTDTFQTAFPERPKDKVNLLASSLANKDGKICEYYTIATVKRYTF